MIEEQSRNPLEAEQRSSFTILMAEDDPDDRYGDNILKVGP
jgi:hypothetical protein